MARRSGEFLELDDSELDTRLEETKAELFNLRFALVTGALDNSARLRVLRRDIARIKTILRAREIEAAEAAVAEK
ncbi:MAG: 50S ribosomal protein L29 [Acidimicrobiia bacterium]